MGVPTRDGAPGPSAVRERRITSADVAREAGLSRTTVSYVLNDTPHQTIPDATRRKVLEAAARLGYAPSAAARALRAGRSDVVLFLMPDWPISTSVGQLLSGLSDAFGRRGLTLVAHPRPHPRPAAEVWRTVGPVAVIGWGAFSADEIREMRSAGVQATASLMTDLPEGGLAVGQRRIGRLQAEHLAAAGHRRLGYALDEDERVREFAESRLGGVREACAELGLEAPVVIAVPAEPDGAERAVARWRADPDPVTGVCAYNDEIALAVLAGMRGHGWTAPRDLAVIGVDDIPAARTAAPPLTTVTTDLGAQADYLAAVTLARLDGTPPPATQDSPPVDVLVRESA